MNETAHITQAVTVSAPGGFLYERGGGGSQCWPAKSGYTVDEIDFNFLWLHGHEVSGAVRDREIEVTHDKSGASDKVKFTVVKVEMVTPAGDPVNSPVDGGDGSGSVADGANEFTFSPESPGVLTLKLKARVTPGGGAEQIKDQCHFTVDGIGASTMAWATANTDGKPTAIGDDLLATATFTGLPANNSDFGAKKAAVYFSGNKQDEKGYEVFFSKTAANHPGGTATDPNWFYYWKDGGVCGIDSDVLYDPLIGYGEYRYGQYVYIGPLAADYNDGIHTYTNRFSSATLQATGNGKGIKSTAETIVHEKLHKYVYQNLSGIDNDYDGIPDAMESTYLGIATATSGYGCSDTYDLSGYFNYSPYFQYGDQEVRCRIVELSAPCDPASDWANPGCQNKNQWGPVE